MKLYSYFRSSAAYRVRIALNLKGVACEIEPVHLVRDGGEHRKPGYLALNPQGRVPALALDDGLVLTQSLAIIDYLEETYPEPSLLPAHPVDRAHARAIAQAIAADIHPLNNTSVLNYLRREMGQDQAAIDAWYAHWIHEGFRVIERRVEGHSFCIGDRPTVADICLVPQVFNARRFGIDLSPYPSIVAIDARCAEIEAFAKARPEAQPDAES